MDLDPEVAEFEYRYIPVIFVELRLGSMPSYDLAVNVRIVLQKLPKQIGRSIMAVVFLKQSKYSDNVSFSVFCF
jgi:hypothetical protein